MEQEIKSDKDYIEAFNQGYELAKELGLKPDILDGLKAGKHRYMAMKEGMEQYGRELTKTKDKDKGIPPLDLDNIQKGGYIPDYSKSKDKDKDKGFDMDF